MTKLAVFFIIFAMSSGCSTLMTVAKAAMVSLAADAAVECIKDVSANKSIPTESTADKSIEDLE